jgi:hypothetical protein
VLALQIKVLVLGERDSNSDPRLGSSSGLCHCPGCLLPAHHHAGHLDDKLDSAGALSAIRGKGCTDYSGIAKSCLAQQACKPCLLTLALLVQCAIHLGR